MKRPNGGEIGLVKDPGWAEENGLSRDQTAGDDAPGVVIARRLGSTPQERGSVSDANCPDMFELSDGRVACIGTDMTAEFAEQLPSGASIGPDERLVVFPRRVLVDALQDVPESWRRLPDGEDNRRAAPIPQDLIPRLKD
jgi:hypothetical protein